MSRYIDADVYIKYCDEHWIPLNVDAVKAQPTADVIPIEWIEEQKDKCFPDSITEISLRHLLADWERRKDDKGRSD